MRTGRAKAVAAVALLALALAAAWLLRPGDASRIRALIREAASAVEREDAGGVMAAISFGFRDERGRGYLELRKALEDRFRRYSDIVVEYEGLEVAVEDGRATATMGLRVIATLGGTRGYYLGDIREPVRLRLALEKGPTGKWLISGAAWTPPPGDMASGLPGVKKAKGG
ncbi:MAG: hypothetical protein Kow0025_23330 [Thermodesulfovibrionales bacterium]